MPESTIPPVRDYEFGYRLAGSHPPLKSKVVMLLINIFLLHFITCLSIAKLNIIISSISISIIIIIMLVYNIFFFHKSKEQSLKITKMSENLK